MTFEVCGCLKHHDTMFAFSQNGSICFTDQNSSLNGTAVHFTCLTDQCEPDCFIVSILSAHRIMVSGTKY